MRQRSFLYILTILTVGIITSKMAYAQSNIDTLWNLLRSSLPIQQDSTVWKLAAMKGINETCISGDCTNGYGISISNNRGFAGRYQYEGHFSKAKHNGVGIVKAETGSVRVGNFDDGEEVGAYLLDNNGLMELHYLSGIGSRKVVKEFGFALEIVQKHLANSFEKFTACKCLVRAIHIVDEEYQQPYDLTDELKNNRGTGYRTEIRRIEYPGLRNSCKHTIYIKAIANEGSYYFDRSLVVLPGNTVMRRPFNLTYTPNKEDIQYLGQYEAVSNGIKN